MLEHVRRGKTNAEIGAALGLSAETAKFHVASMLSKLQLRSREELATWQPDESAAAGRTRRLAPLGLLLRPAVLGGSLLLAVIAATAGGLVLWWPGEPAPSLVTGGLDPTASPGGGTPTGQATGTPDMHAPAPSPTADPRDPWAAFRSRPLDPPAVVAGESCPVTPGGSVAVAGQVFSVYGSGGTADVGTTREGFAGFVVGRTGAAGGPVLVRFARLDGPTDFLLMDDPYGRAPGTLTAAEWRMPRSNPEGDSAMLALGSNQPGCYAMQVDGDGIHDHVVFRLPGRRS